MNNNIPLEVLATVARQTLNCDTNTALEYARRVADMQHRGIGVAEVEMYLKSAGWYSKKLVELYTAVLGLTNKHTEEIGMTPTENEVTEDEVTKNNKVQAIPSNVVTELLNKLVSEFAEAAGFRLMAEGETSDEYKESLIEYITKYIKAYTENSLKYEAIVQCKKLSRELTERLELL